jgi:hypothetical protein
MPIRSRNIEDPKVSGALNAAQYGGITASKLEEQHERVTDKIITSAQVLALNATPVTVIAAPGANKAIIFLGAVVASGGGTAYAGIAATEEFSLKYTNGAGLNVATVEATGWLDQTTAQVRWVYPHVKNITVDTPEDITPVANAALVAHMLVGEITTGNYPISVRVYYRIVPTTIATLV